MDTDLADMEVPLSLKEKLQETSEPHSELYLRAYDRKIAGFQLS